MTPEQLLAHVESLGIHLAAEGGRLRVNAPRGGLTDALKASIGAAKDALIALLERRVAAQSAGIQPRERASARSVSSFQERLWILQRMEPGNTAYNMVHVWKNAASADAATVVAAIGSLLVRHEILRSSFDDAAGTLAAHTLPPESVPVEVRDLNTVASAEQRRRVEADLEVEVRRPFDLTVGPAVRFIVYRISATETATLLAAHHIAVDAWSIALVEQEIAAACAPGAAALDVPRLQYADYAAWQRTTQDPKVIASDLEWWSRYLARAPQLSAFPADLRAAADTMGTREVVGATRTYVWNQELTAGIRTLARKQGATLYMALMAACATVLRWHTGQEDLVLGSPMGVRERTELETMIGPFVNLMLVRLDITGNPTFAELLRRTRDSMLEAHEHRHVPFETLVERLKPVRSLEHSPLFQVAIVQHNAPDASDGSVRANGGAMHELTWFAREIPAGLECSLEYRADLYSPAAIDRIAAHLEAVLRRAVENSERRAGELSVLPNAELAQIEAFNATSQRWEETTFVAQFERRAAASPESTALAYEHVALSYDELNRRANRLAHQLRVSGVSRGSLVALCVERSPSLIVALLAILKAGGTYVPLDPGFPMDRLSFMLADSGSTVLLTSGDAAGGIDVPERVTVVDLTYEPALQSSENLELEARPEDAAYIIYTSGSTGRPKGVAVSHGSLMNFLWSMAREPGLEAADVLAAVTTISFDIAGLELYLPLLVGARVELVARETAADGPALAALLTERGATVLQATPATWRLLVEADWHARPGFRGFCGGEALPRDLADSLLERVGELWNLYGPTETTIWSSVERVQRGDEITIGHPIANTQVYIVGNSGELQPIGVPGEIWIGGEGVAIGYHHRPELTAERFVAASFGAASGRRLYRTGDLGRWRGDGRIEHLGRLDDQVKIRGFRIELGEIESVLATLAAVRQAVVVARDAGPSDRRLVAYVVYQPGEDLTVSEVRRHLRGTLPDYMVPSLVVAIDAIPLTPNGKMDRAALPDPFQNARAATAEYEAPVSQMERLLADVWTDVLKVERVGLHDNFFELGGHSLLSLRVAGAVQKRSGWRMDPRTLFFQTLSQIAATGATAGDQVLRRA